MNRPSNKPLLVTCVVFGVVVIWFAGVIIHLERYRYANQSHLCYKPEKNYVVDADAYFERENCLETAVPRTSGLWDLYYALTD